MNHHETSRLYESIQQSDWKSASRALRLYPEEASSWVVLLHPPHPDERDHEGGTPTTTTMMTTQRFLPLHSALARNPPITFVRALMEAYPAGVREKDGTGMLPLHYACGNRCCLEILQLLLLSSSSLRGEEEGGGVGGMVGYDEAVWDEDVNGMTPLHYVASWGPSELGVVELLLRAAESTSGGAQRTVRELILQKDVRGMTPLALAREAEYDGREEVVAVMERWLNGSNLRGDHRLGLQVITTTTTNAAAPSPTARRSSHAITRSEGDFPFSLFESESHHRDRQGNGRYSSRHVPREGTDAMMISTVHEKEKHVHHPLMTPRSNSSGSTSGRRPSQEYPIHLISDRRSPSEDSRSGSVMRRHTSATPRDSLDDNNNNSGDDDENALQRTRSERYSSNSPLHPISSTTPSIRTESSPMTPTIMNMKTPRSSGRGARFGFDLSSPRYYTASPPTAGGLLSPRAQPSPRGQFGTPLHSQPQNLEVVTSELQRLQLENETLRKECSQKDLENQELCAKLSHYEQGERRRGGGDGIAPSSPDIHHTSIIRHLNALLHSLLEREKALTEAVNAMQQRESIRRNRTQTMMKLLVEEEEEEQERNSLERIFGKEIRGLEEVRDEVGRMLEGLGG
ncbi:hypothetical protein HJC23_006774 [Cyclotella cryptica]|uniref:Ankyrin n=1 Tax=Cyclotella cryptica TaxID=29204 RepID=A0ABD3NNQ4_9STRA|eukprot:CCRYP_020430-RA/>CCRYP_020430-RA protein AED:0.27 eAED:0.27 QI:0/-1/0/1/-1/1/1/0/626